jgi:hypothetical protein
MCAMHKSAPETVKARSAHVAISQINQRVERAALSWAKTGKMSGLPEGMQSEMMGAAGGGSGFLGAVAGFAKSGFGKGLLGFLGGGGNPEISFGGKEKEKEKGEGGGIQKKSNRGGTAGAVEDATRVKEQLGSGQALDGRVQGRMSSAFGYDFSGVRVHTDSKAGELSSQLNARAFTIGSDVAFAGGEYTPGTLVGDALIAHELAHVVQQGGGKEAGPQTKDTGLSDDSSLEQDADRSAVGVVVAGLTGAKKGLAEVGANALPRLKSGLKLQKCNCNKKEKLPAQVQISEEELRKYLDTLDQTGKIEAADNSANKAREVVRHWQQGDALYILTSQRKTLLIQQILQAGEAGESLQSGIIDLFSGTGGAEFEQIVQKVGEEPLKKALSEDNRKTLESMLASRRKQRAEGAKPTADEARETFAPEGVLEAQRKYTSNAEILDRKLRKDCIRIVRDRVPDLFKNEPAVAERVATELGKLQGKTLKMTEAAQKLTDLGVADGPTEITFANGNGLREPGPMKQSAWDAIISQVGKVEGWHIFGLAPFNGFHSVVVLVDNRPDGPRVYWADQWALETEEERAGGFGQKSGSVSGFRRYEKDGFDGFINQMTREWWNRVHTSDSEECAKKLSDPTTWDQKCRWLATLKIWHFHHGK